MAEPEAAANAALLELSASEKTMDIAIIDGISKNTFTVQKELITKYSPYFAKVFGGSYEEVEVRAIDLAGTNARTFEKFLRGLECQYNSELTMVDDGDDDYVWEDGLVGVAIDAYLFAATYDAPKLRRRATNRLVLYFEDNPGDVKSKSATRAYNNTPKGSPLRKVLVDGFCKGRIYWNQSHKSLLRYPKAFLADALLTSSLEFNTTQKNNV